MQWADKLGTLKQGLCLVVRVAKAELPVLRPSSPVPRSAGLAEWGGFGPNPGHLSMQVRIPIGNVAARRPLIVLLHGCGQETADFAVDTGWAAVSDRLGIPLVLPEQAMANNGGRCFRWFQPAETTRDGGEAASIAAMTRAAMARFESDPTRIFIADLSAGGAMAAALLASYPDLYAAGAVVAGLPVGSADSPMQALLHMANAGPDRRPAEWADHVRRMAPPGYAGPWPRLSVWHGDADETVVPGNGALLAGQWRAVHGQPAAPAVDEIVAGARHRVWGNAVELWTLPGMTHGYPVGAGVGRTASFMLDRGLPATPRIAAFWKLS
jgi:poly(hydroxyalkanoate) depolymerase family esterase